LQQQQNTMQRLHSQLESVREIKEGMGVHSPRIDELAILQEAHRLHLARNANKKKRKKHGNMNS